MYPPIGRCDWEIHSVMSQLTSVLRVSLAGRHGAVLDGIFDRGLPSEMRGPEKSATIREGSITPK